MFEKKYFSGVFEFLFFLLSFFADVVGSVFGACLFKREVISERISLKKLGL